MKNDFIYIGFDLKIGTIWFTKLTTVAWVPHGAPCCNLKNRC